MIIRVELSERLVSGYKVVTRSLRQEMVIAADMRKRRCLRRGSMVFTEHRVADGGRPPCRSTPLIDR